MSSEHTALTVENLRFSYESSPLLFPNLNVNLGETCAVLGPSGCGKTTFLHLIAGLLTPESGSVEVLDRNINTMSQRDRDHFRGRHIGIVLQQLRLIRALTVKENLLLAQRLAGADCEPERARYLLKQLGLEGMEQRKPAELSQGQAQRVAIARALMNKPAVILADEPTSSLDDEQAENVTNLLAEIAKTHKTAVILVTHDSRIRGRMDQEVVLS
jgi:ABC-type lipoprotein export system ATPase subunit